MSANELLFLPNLGNWIPLLFTSLSFNIVEISDVKFSQRWYSSQKIISFYMLLHTCFCCFSYPLHMLFTCFLLQSSNSMQMSTSEGWEKDGSFNEENGDQRWRQTGEISKIYFRKKRFTLHSLTSQQMKERWKNIHANFWRLLCAVQSYLITVLRGQIILSP